MSDNVESITVRILERIHDDVSGIRSDIQQTNARIEHAIVTFGAAWREHEEWLCEHDVRIGKRAGHPPRRPFRGPPRRRR